MSFSRAVSSLSVATGDYSFPNGAHPIQIGILRLAIFLVENLSLNKSKK